MTSLTFLPPPAISQFLIAAISFVIDCKDLNVAQTAQIDQLFPLISNLIRIYDDFCYGVPCMLMSKNVSNDVTINPPIENGHPDTVYCVGIHETKFYFTI